MAFALQLNESLRFRESQAPLEFANGDTLGIVLTRYLLAVEATTDSNMLTSILLLDGSRLRHGAAPNLPATYCDAIDGLEIGPGAGSCGTAAFFGHPIYVTDIATDPLWIDYREIALRHGLHACWSTPICTAQGAVIGTFAIYHLTPRSPTRDEVTAIRTITDHVARAIMWSSGTQDDAERPAGGKTPRKPYLKLVDDSEPHGPDQLLRAIAHNFEALARVIERTKASLEADEPESSDIERLSRVKKASEKGAALARNALSAGAAEPPVA
jgi:hypothetical protein